MYKIPRIITVDLDGTLFLPDHVTISSRTFQTLSRCVAGGAEIVPVTGRCEGLIPLPEMPPVHYVISCNGAIVSDTVTGRILHTDYIPHENLVKAWEIIRRYEVVLELFVDRDIVIERKIYENLDRYTRQIPRFHPRYFKTGRATVIESFDQYIQQDGKRVTKINLPGKNIEGCPELLEELQKLKLFDISTDGSGLEATNVGCNKGAGLRWLCQYLGASPSEAVSFGDGDNDISILSCAGWGVAMGNAHSSVKSHAGYCTAANTEDGIAEFLEKNFDISVGNQ